MSESQKDNGGRPDGAAPIIEFEEANVDISDVRLIDIPALIVFWVLLGVVFLQFYTRYILNDSYGWTEEVSRFLLILVGFVGSVTAVRKGSHIFLEFFYRFVPAKFGKALSIFAETISLGFYTSCAWFTAELAMITRQRMVSIEVPKSAIYWAVSASFALMAVFTVVWIVHKIRLSSQDVIDELEGHTRAD